LDCPPEFTPFPEEHLKQSINSHEIVEDIDEFVGLDDDAKARAIKRRDEADKKIAQKNFEAVDKAKERISKKAQKMVEADNASAVVKMKGKKKKELEPPSSTIDEGSQHQRSFSRGTKRDAEYTSLSTDEIHHGPAAVDYLKDSEITISEFILNYSLADVLADPLPKVYDDLVSFIDKVSSVHILYDFSVVYFMSAGCLCTNRDDVDAAQRREAVLFQR
jgi:hypothetical protein